MKPSLLNLPPKFDRFRSYPGFDQWEICKRIAVAFTTRRHVLLHAPPGVGKTLIAATVQKLIPASDSSREPRMLFLTPSRGLQDQLASEFDTVRAVKGRSNYYCPEFRGGCDLPALCESVCSIEKPGNNQLSNCGYRVAIRNAYDSLTPSGNYAFWLSLARYGDPNALGDIDLLVCDEAHTILNTLTDFVSIVLSPEDCRTYLGLQLPRYADCRAWSEWARHTAFKPACAALNKINNVATNPKVKAKVTALCKAITTDLTMIGFDDEKEYDRWIPDIRELNVKISPLWPGKLTEQYLFRSIPRVLLCSGSLTPETITDLGIDRHTAEFIEVGSVSPPSNRPIIYLNSTPEIKVERSMSSGEKRAIVRKIDLITDVWGEYPGLILPTSYEWRDIILNETRHRGMYITHDSGKAQEAVNLFRPRSSGILLTPAGWEGYDLPDCMWIVIPKIPFLISNDPLLQARKKERKGFANSIIAAKLLQGSLRHIRSRDAKGVVFILDWHWTHFQNSTFFPQYYRSAWRVRSEIPTPKELGFR